MLNYIWIGLIVVSCIYGFISGKGKEMTDAFFSSSENCINFILKTGAFMIMWQGVLSVTEKSGLSKKIASFFSPLITFLFSGVKKGGRSARLISNNITANILGLSNAATPLGIEAMKELSKKSRNGVATNDMCLLAVLNSASLQLVPSTLIAMRTGYMSASPGEIIVPVWISSFFTVVFAVCMAKLLEKRS